MLWWARLPLGVSSINFSIYNVHREDIKGPVPRTFCQVSLYIYSVAPSTKCETTGLVSKTDEATILNSLNIDISFDGDIETLCQSLHVS